MRVLVLPLALVLVVLLALLIAASSRPGRREPPRWESATELRDGVTIVLVRQVVGGREVGRQIVAEIPADVPDWETRYHEAMAAARSRAAAFRSEAD
ncbi:hypothetical protein [Actinoallomurus rhizosphaericola]|uniref:hypothetical protein n=1 Tax=Actinoallomurus rhizosphaericola TaxID=2952536 RepID=UPI0020901B33|nr:hypothetical protein [Actinoallomurus rhizosphaericola]MCO5992514.1 hypothetical protein [Actinoallomurus rhizosphaericola]